MAHPGNLRITLLSQETFLITLANFLWPCPGPWMPSLCLPHIPGRFSPVNSFQFPNVTLPLASLFSFPIHTSTPSILVLCPPFHWPVCPKIPNDSLY